VVPALSDPSSDRRRPLFARAARALPHSPEMEQAVLGGLIANARCYEALSGVLRAEHFHDPAHAAIYEAIAARIESGRIADAL
jgi:replicative DNA helicase